MSSIRRIGVLWENITGYMQAALGGLLKIPEINLFVVQRISQANAPFEPSLTERTILIRRNDLPPDDMNWLSALLDFAPEVVLISGGPDLGYREAARRLDEAGTITVWASDRVLRSRWRDLYQVYLGRIRRRWRHYNLAFVPGKAGAGYARSIGFSPDRIFQGLYTCDTALFRPVGMARHRSGISVAWPPIFLFLGQFIERKGIDLLLHAYRLYRAKARDPWELWCVGNGPLASQVDAAPGVRRLPFLSPEGCAKVMEQAGTLILPSLWDHWGVVLHEAACAGLPVIASEGCGAVQDLVVSGRNGCTFPVGDVDRLANCLLRMSAEDQAREMGAESLCLSYRFSPDRFAQVVCDLIPAVVRR